VAAASRDWQANASDDTMRYRKRLWVSSLFGSFATQSWKPELTVSIDRNGRTGRNRSRAVPTKVYEDDEVRFEYPFDWALQVTEDDSVKTVSLDNPSGIAFLLVQTDPSCPDPEDVAEAALEGLREEYPELDAVPAEEVLKDHCAEGYDVDFVSLDLSNSASIRSFRTPRRTVLVFGQWSELVEDDIPGLIKSVLRSIEMGED
jgi:hypothetical protein